MLTLKTTNLSLNLLYISCHCRRRRRYYSFKLIFFLIIIILYIQKTKFQKQVAVIFAISTLSVLGNESRWEHVGEEGGGVRLHLRFRPVVLAAEFLEKQINLYQISNYL